MQGIEHEIVRMERVKMRNEYEKASKRDADIIASLESQIESLQKQNRDLSLLLKRDDYEKLSKQLEEAQKQNEVSLMTIESLVADKKRLAQEKNELLKMRKKVNEGEERQDKKAIIDENSVDLIRKEERIDELECLLGEANQRVEVVEEKYRELEEMLEDYQLIKQERDELQGQVEDLSLNLGHLQGHVQMLESRLASLDSTFGEENQGKEGEEEEEEKQSKTFFSELDDKRKQLEEQNEQLAQKHKGLLQNHSVVLSQQERMKNHINRLTQLTKAKASQVQVEQLTRALAQSESEKKLLQIRIEELEMSGATVNLIGPTGEANGSGEMVGYLNAKIKQLEIDNEKIKKQVETANFMRSAESDKARALEAQLGKTLEEMDSLRVELAQVSFKFEELAMKVNLVGREEVPVIRQVSQLEEANEGDLVKAEPMETAEDEQLPAKELETMEQIKREPLQPMENKPETPQENKRETPKKRGPNETKVTRINRAKTEASDCKQQ